MAAPGSGPAGNKRQPLLIDVSFQLRELLPMAVFAGLYAVLLFIVLFLPLGRKIAAEPDLGVRLILQGHLDDIHLRLWPLLLVAFLAAAYLRIYRSVRVLRPVYSLHYALRDLAAGEHPSLTVSPREEFGFLADDVAQLNQKMKLLSTRNRDILLNVQAHIKKMNERINSGEIIPRADLEEFLATIRAQVDKATEAGPVGRH